MQKDFVRSGYITLYYDSLKLLGIYGHKWSPVPVAYSSTTAAQAYNLALIASGVYPSGGPDHRWLGFPVRCLVYQLI